MSHEDRQEQHTGRVYTPDEVNALVADAYRQGFAAGVRGWGLTEHASAIQHGDPAASHGAAVFADQQGKS